MTEKESLLLEEIRKKGVDIDKVIHYVEKLSEEGSGHESFAESFIKDHYSEGTKQAIGDLAHLIRSGDVELIGDSLEKDLGQRRMTKEEFREFLSSLPPIDVDKLISEEKEKPL